MAWLIVVKHYSGLRRICVASMAWKGGIWDYLLIHLLSHTSDLYALCTSSPV